MLDITKTFTIQWVGPFKNLQEMKIYLKDETTCQNSLFNFYYFSGNKKRKRMFNIKSLCLFGYT